MTDQEKIENAAAENFERGITLSNKNPEITFYEQSFIDGVTWRDANPSEDVLALVESLKGISVYGVSPDATAIAAIADKALARWDARGK